MCWLLIIVYRFSRICWLIYHYDYMTLNAYLLQLYLMTYNNRLDSLQKLFTPNDEFPTYVGLAGITILKRVKLWPVTLFRFRWTNGIHWTYMPLFEILNLLDDRLENDSPFFIFSHAAKIAKRSLLMMSFACILKIINFLTSGCDRYV